MPGVDLREVLANLDGSYPLRPADPGRATFGREGVISSSAAEYFLISPPASGGLALGVSGPDGRPPEPAMGLRVLVVRLR